MPNLRLHWDSSAPSSKVQIDEIPHFDARGMRRVYGRGDHFRRRETYNMDIWINRSGRLLMRCWSRCADADDCSFEIKGIAPSEIPEKDEREGFLDIWLPEVVRKTYEEWVEEQF